jgi:hypothetical protein
LWVSTKFIQIKALGSKFAPPQLVIDFPYFYTPKNEVWGGI